MEKPPKKVARNFRIDAALDTQLEQFARETGFTRIQILEDALRMHFAGGMKRRLEATLKRLPKGTVLNFSSPLAPEPMPVAA